MTKCNLTEQEISMITEACTEYLELMVQGEDTHDYTLYMLENGLGSAMNKIYKGKHGEDVYAKYKSHREGYVYPTFEEWLKKHKEDDEEEG